MINTATDPMTIDELSENDCDCAMSIGTNEDAQEEQQQQHRNGKTNFWRGTAHRYVLDGDWSILNMSELRSDLAVALLCASRWG